MQTSQKTRKAPKLNFATVGVTLLVVLCLVVLVYDLRTNTPDEDALLAEAPLNDGGITDGGNTPEPNAGANPNTNAPTMAGDDSFYSEYRLQREQVRSEELELLQSIIDDPGSSQEMRDLANSRKLAIAENMEYELMTENVLYAKDFGQTVVMMGRDTATVVLTGVLDDITAAQVADAVTSVTGVSFENVVIIYR